jgi:hypothetical protein
LTLKIKVGTTSPFHRPLPSQPTTYVRPSAENCAF